MDHRRATEWDMWSCDPRRSHHADEPYAIAKGMEVYGHEYAMHFPQHEWPAGRDKNYRQCMRPKRNGAVMGAIMAGSVQLFCQRGDDTSHEATQTWSRKGLWEER